MSKVLRSVPRIAVSATALALALLASGCRTTPGKETTGSISTPAITAQTTEADWRREIETWRPRYEANTADADAAVNYARALRAIGQRQQAAAVLQQTAMRQPKNQAVLGAYGRALSDIGDYPQALEVLGKAHTPDRPDWRILSAQGTVLDRLGRHPEAQENYRSALRLQPDDPSVMSNYGLSLALTKDLKQAEEMLRRAASRPGADSRVRQNLGLVIGLQGRFDEAERMVSADLPPDQAQANVAYLRQMLSQQNSWSKMGGAEQRKPGVRAPQTRPAADQPAQTPG